MVLVSDYEGSSVALKEALAMNLPVVATPVGDAKELFKELSGTYLVEQQVDQVAEAIDKAIKHGPTNGRERIEKLSVDHTVSQIKEIYESVMKGSTNGYQQ